jgi:hypothetical protein
MTDTAYNVAMTRNDEVFQDAIDALGLAALTPEQDK